MEIIRRKLAKSIQEVRLRNEEQLKEDSSFMEFLKDDCDNYKGKFQKYLADSPIKQRLVWATLFRKMEWHIKYGLKLALKHDQHETRHLVQAAQYGYWWLTLGLQITTQHRKPDNRNSAVQLRDATRAISYLLLTGHDQQAAEVSRICNKEINTQFITGGYKWMRHPWFLLDLVSRWQNLPLDLSDCHLPDEMGVYPQVLADWDTQDTDQVQQLVTLLADFHMDQAQEDHDDGDEEEPHEFFDSNFWFFPYEILAWLRIRELMGLPNPETYEHPLMQQPLGQMPPDTPFPEDELLTQVVAKLKADHGIA